MELSLAVTVLSISYGLLLSWIVARTDTPCRGALNVMFTMPLFMSPFIGTIAWVNLAGPDAGLINRFLNWLIPATDYVSYFNIFSFGGIVWCMVLYFVPFAYNFNVSVLNNLDSDLEDAARSTGASEAVTLLRITFPLILPSIVSAAIYIFVLSAEMFSIPGLLGPTVRYFTLSYVIFLKANHWPMNIPEAAAIGILLVLITLLGIYYYRKITAISNKFVTISAKGQSNPTLKKLGKWKWLTLAIGLVYFFAAVVLPLFALVIGSLLPFTSAPITWQNLTIAHYKELLLDLTVAEALRNTILLAPLSATIVFILGIVISYINLRTHAMGRRFLDYLASIPIAIPGIVFALGIRIFYINTPLYATIWILLIAFVTRQISYATRISNNSMFQIHSDLENSAEVCGAGTMERIRKIFVPIMREPIFFGWIFVFLAVVREINAAVMLYSTRSNVLSIVSWNYMYDGRYDYASVVGVIQTVLMLGVLLVGLKILKINFSTGTLGGNQ
jgi:iron(III) transport system permease protein